MSYRMISVGLCVMALLASGVSVARAQVPRRSGFTLELGMGPSAYQVFSPDVDTRGEFTAGVNIGVGGFVSDRLALMGRIQVVSRPAENLGSEGLAIGHLQIQFWLSDRIFVSAGTGMAVYFLSAPLGEALMGKENQDHTGFGFSLRTGYSFARWERHLLRVTLELASCAFDDLNVLAESVALEWQWH